LCLKKATIFYRSYSYPDAGYDGGASATPIYNSTLNYLVAGKLNVDNVVSPAVLYMVKLPFIQALMWPKTIVLDKYDLTGVLYIDWK
jgi:hypothetical protein